MIRYNEDGTTRLEYLQWKVAHDDYKARARGFASHSEQQKAIAEEKKGKDSVVAMLAAMGKSMMSKVRSGGKQASKKSAGAAVKHLRQKV